MEDVRYRLRVRLLVFMRLVHALTIPKDLRRICRGL